MATPGSGVGAGSFGRNWSGMSNPQTIDKIAEKMRADTIRELRDNLRSQDEKLNKMRKDAKQPIVQNFTISAQRTEESPIGRAGMDQRITESMLQDIKKGIEEIRDMLKNAKGVDVLGVNV